MIKIDVYLVHFSFLNSNLRVKFLQREKDQNFIINAKENKKW